MSDRSKQTFVSASPSSASAPRSERTVAVVVLVVVCTVACLTGVRATHDLNWPPGADASRDIANAEGLSTGRVPFPDPFYRGEIDWYNPLVPGTVAVAAAIFREPIPLVYARLGAYLNVLAPIALFVLLWRLFEPKAAALGVVAFVFLMSDGPALFSATYSPWLLPIHTVQTLFYVTLAAIVGAWRARSVRAFAAAGLLCGLTFLGHTAPFLLLSGVVCLDALICVTRFPRQVVTHAAVFFGAAAAVSAVFWAPLAYRYAFLVRSPDPMIWAPPEMALDRFGPSVAALLVITPASLIVAFGVLCLLRNMARPESRLIVLTAALAFAGVAAGYWGEYEKGRGITPWTIVPAFHFVYYLGFVRAVAFGVGGATLINTCVRLLKGKVDSSLMNIIASASLLVVALVLIARDFDAYRARADFLAERASAERMFEDPTELRLYRWIRTASRPSDVFLIDERSALSVVGAAGRKAVAVPNAFSNPYVDREARSEDRAEMQAALERGDCQAFRKTASKYDVAWVARYDPFPNSDAVRACLSQTLASGRWTVYSVLLEVPAAESRESGVDPRVH